MVEVPDGELIDRPLGHNKKTEEGGRVEDLHRDVVAHTQHVTTVGRIVLMVVRSGQWSLKIFYTVCFLYLTFIH